MSTTHKIKTWIDTGTGRQAESEIEVEVAGATELRIFDLKTLKAVGRIRLSP